MKISMGKTVVVIINKKKDRLLCLATQVLSQGQWWSSSLTHKSHNLQ
jgi:hypothetical protein